MFIKNEHSSKPIYALILVGMPVLLLLTVFIYLPGINGPLILDDFNNLSKLREFGGIENLTTLRLFVFDNFSGPSGRPLSMLSFLIDGQDWPIVTARYKYTNVLLHCLNCLLSIWVLFLLCQTQNLPTKTSIAIPIAASAFWVLHPLNVSTTLYVVQRMTQLMMLFGMFSLVSYIKGRYLLIANRRLGYTLIGISLFPFLFLATMSKENGVLFLFLVISIEGFLLKNLYRPHNYQTLYKFFVLLPALLTTIAIFWFLASTFENFDMRRFSLFERVLTESRILVSYIVKIFLPSQSIGTIFQETYVVSTNPFSPISTLFSFGVISFFLTTAWMFRAQHSIYSLGVFWFFSQHIIESTFLPLELYFEHRNYIAMLGPIFAATYYSYKFINNIAFSEKKTWLYFLSFSFVATYLILILHSCVENWSSRSALLEHSRIQWPTSIRSNVSSAAYFESSGDLELARNFLHSNLENFPNEVVVLLGLWNFDCRNGNPLPYSLGSITANNELEYYGDNVGFALNGLLANLSSSNCHEGDLDSVDVLYEKISSLPMPGRRKESFWEAYADYNLFRSRHISAIDNLQKNFDQSPRVDIALRQLSIASTAGYSELAFQFLEQARLADSNRRLGLPSRTRQIDIFEAALISRLSDTSQ